MFMLSNYLKVIAFSSYLQEVSFAMKADASSARKTIDFRGTAKKEVVIGVLNVVVKYIGVSVIGISFDGGKVQGDSKGELTEPAATAKVTSNCIELKAEDGVVIVLLFDAKYTVKEEEFYVILEKARIDTSQLSM